MPSRWLALARPRSFALHRRSEPTMMRRAASTQHTRIDTRACDRNVPLRRRVLIGVGSVALAITIGATWGVAQESRLARIIVPFAPGAAVDVVGRMLAGALSAQWGKMVIVENRPGGRTLIAAEAVAHSEPDGDTLLLCLDDTFTIVPHLSKHAPLDPNKELVPINLVGTITMAMVVNPSLPVDSFRRWLPTRVSERRELRLLRLGKLVISQRRCSRRRPRSTWFTCVPGSCPSRRPLSQARCRPRFSASVPRAA